MAKGPKPRPVADRFWEKVSKPTGFASLNGCWLWTGATDGGGYGHLMKTREGLKYKAHRLSYELNVGPVPPRLHVCHKCDNPPCVRPDHLFIGTNIENRMDMQRKGRALNKGQGVKGSTNCNAKLTVDTVKLIFSMRALGLSQTSIAAAVGVKQATISCVLLGKTWSHVKVV